MPLSGPPQSDSLSVSLEPHLVERLRHLVHVIPAPLSAELAPLLSETSSSSTTPTISYALLSSLSRWVRTEGGTKALKSEDPPLDPLAYSMVALLAGTRTSPDKKFPQSSRSAAAGSEEAAREISDRRAIVAVLNALLSVICTGAGVWWAAQRTGWRDEWRVLLSLLAATIVAVSEVGLYIIWESRRRRRPPAKTEATRRLHPHDYSVGDTNSRDIGGDTPSEPARLDVAPSQASTSIDPHQSSTRMALRQRVGPTSKSSSR